MKKFILAIILLTVVPLLLGMGSLQGQAPVEKIPVPVKQYNATIVDQADVFTECTHISIEGATFLEGKRGEGNYTISFDNIEQVLFRLNSERLTGTVKLYSGGTHELILNKNQRVYGRTTYGTFQIKLMDLKKLTITSSSQK
jgi:hypothetical protein